MSWTTSRASRGARAIATVFMVALSIGGFGCSSAVDAPGQGLAPAAGDVPAKFEPTRTHARTVTSVAQGGARPANEGTLTDAGGSPATGDKVQYLGGPVISNVQIYAIFWGATVNTQVQNNIGGFYQTITNSPYWSWLAEYSTVDLGGTSQTIGPGTFVRAITITPANQNTTISEVDIATELQGQVTRGVIPGPHETTNGLDSAGNVNVIYMIDFPSTVTVTSGGSQSCVSGGFCGFHEAAAITDLNSVTYNVPFGVLADTFQGPCTAGCGSSTPLNNSYSIHSHELVEALTDAIIAVVTPGSGVSNGPLAWYDVADPRSQIPNGGEVADICNEEQGSVMGYTVQKIWSNVNAACIDVPPACNGSLNPPYCTPCTSSSECSGALPVCDTTVGSPFAGECVACTGTTGCGGLTPYCDPTTDTCRACMASDCTGTTPICETSGTASGTCVACDAENHSSCTGATPVCDPAVFVCVGCVTTADCPSSTPICDVATQTCRTCAANSDCPGDVCDTQSGSSKVGQCVGCLANTDCGGANADCDQATNTCTCTSDSQCDNPKPTCTANRCVACKSDGDCSASKSGPVCTNGSCGPRPAGSFDAGYDASITLATLPDAGKGGSSGGGCTTTPTSAAADLASFFVPALAFLGVRSRRRARSQRS